MVVRDTVLLGDPRLRERSEPVEDLDELRPILLDLKDTLTRHQETYGMGRGIAAPQIGYRRRVVYVQMPERSFYLVNPVVEWISAETFEVWDSCFSLEAAFFVKIPRSKAIRVRFLDELGGEHVEEFRDGMSELLQHEIDHLDGVVCSDHLRDPRDIVMRAEWEKRYRTPGVGM
ncbi:MAG: peptide deformylase [Candidatus Bathyarchaeota archaeon]